MDGSQSPSAAHTNVAPAPAKARARSKWRWALYILGPILGIVVVTGALAAIFWSQIARVLIERAASNRGVDLTAKYVSLSLSEAHLEDVDASFKDLPGLHVHADSVDVDLATLKPKRAHLLGVAIDADDPEAVLRVLRATPGTTGGGLPGDAVHVTLRLRKLSSSLPVTIEVTAYTLAHDAGRTVLSGLRGTVPVTGTPLGPYDLALTKNETGTTVTTSALPNLVATISRDGAVTATLDHFVIPHPAALDGLGLAEQAKLTGRVEVSKDGLTLKEVVLADGALSLKGDADLSLAHGGHFEANLGGSVACGKLAADVIAARAGLEGNPLARMIAGQAVSGDVGVHLHVAIDAPDFQVHVTPTLESHCGLGI